MRYCMRIKLSGASSLWCCEECQRLPDTCMVETKSAVASKRNSVGKTSKRDFTDCSFYLGTSETPVKRRSPLSNKITTNAQSDSVGGSAKTLADFNRRTAQLVIASTDTLSKISEARETEIVLAEEVVPLSSDVRSITNVSVNNWDVGKVMLPSLSGRADTSMSKSLSIIPHENKVLPVDNVDAFRSPEKCITTCNDVKDPVAEGKESGTAFNSDSELKKNVKMKLPSCKQEEMNLPPLKKEGMNLPQFRKEKMNVPLVFVPTQQTCWMGRLNVFDLVSHEYTGIQARYATWISVKVWEISKHLPEVLNLKVLQRSQVWPPTFQQDPPTESDIGLYLFPCQSGRHKEKHMRLVERLDSNDQAMSGVVNDIELLVFVSNKLPAESQRIDGQKYLWVLFRHLKQQKHKQQMKVQSHPSMCAQLESSMGKNRMEVDKVKEQKTRRTNKSTPSCDPNIPPKSSIKGTDAITNIPPGFSRKLNHKCQKESHQTTVKGPRNHKEVDMLDTERIERSVPSCDTVILPKFPNKGTDRTDVKNPPGFCEKLSSESQNSHQTIFKVLRSDKEVDMVKDQETGSDEKSIQNCDPGVSPKFSNKVTDATDPKIPPGFTEKMSSKYQYKSHQTILKGPRNNKEVSMVKQEETGKTKKSIPGCHPDIPPKFSCETTDATDSDIPPGFTEKQRNKPPETRGKVPTDLDVPPSFTNKVTDATDPHVPPGFSEKLSSKYHSRSPEINSKVPTSSRLHGSGHEDYCAIVDVKSCEGRPAYHKNSNNLPESAVHHKSNSPLSLVEENIGCSPFNADGNGTKHDFKVKNHLLSSSFQERSTGNSAMKNTNLSKKICLSSSPISDQKKPICPVSDVCNSAINKSSQIIVALETKFEEDDMEIDMIGGVEIGKIDVPIPRGDREQHARNVDAAPSIKKNPRIISPPPHNGKGISGGYAAKGMLGRYTK